MKKIISLFMVLGLCLSLCACGVDKEKVEEDLQGTWAYSWYASAAGMYCSVVYEFNGTLLTKTSIRGDDMSSKDGFYIITDKAIEIYFYGEVDPDAKLTYSFTKDNELSLVDYGDGSVENTYIKIQ